jgi:Fructose-2,6-bisphosphatase
MKILLVRHGQSIANINKRQEVGVPDHLVYLTDEGKRQIHQTARFMKDYFNQEQVDAKRCRMWVSPFIRTRQTSEIMNEYLGWSDVKEDGRLVEQSFGLFDGVPRQRWNEMFPLETAHLIKLREEKASYWARFPMGENPLDVAVRVKSFFSTIMRDYNKHGIDTLIIITHGVTLRVFTMEWLHYAYEWYEEERNPKNGAVRLIESREDKGYLFTPG